MSNCYFVRTCNKFIFFSNKICIDFLWFVCICVHRYMYVSILQHDVNSVLLFACTTVINQLVLFFFFRLDSVNLFLFIKKLFKRFIDMNWNTVVPQFAPNSCSSVNDNNSSRNVILDNNISTSMVQPPISSESMNNCFTNAVMMNTSNTNVMSAPYNTNGLTTTTSGESNFGIVVPGKPVNTMIEMVDNTRWTASIGVAPENFMIFMINAAAWLPNEFGIGVYLARCDDMLFQYLGSLTHARQSALFKTPASFFINEHAT